MPFRPLKSFFSTPDELLRQDLPILGAVLLTHLKSYEGLNTVYQHAGLNRGYFRAMLENRNVGLGPLPKESEYGIRQHEVTRRMMEGWNWLERQGLLIRNDEQPADWFVISSDGEKLLEGEAIAEKYRASRPADADDDRRFMVLAIKEAKKSVAEDGRPHPKVGAVVVKDGKVLAKAHRGENPKSHAEYVALEEKLPSETLANATVYTTLEPCTKRNLPKICCAQRLMDRRVARVFIGMLDPNPDIRGLGDQLLSEAGIETQLFPRDLRAQVEEMNRDFIRDQKQKWQARASSTSRETRVDSLTHLAESSGLQHTTVSPRAYPSVKAINPNNLKELRVSGLAINQEKLAEGAGLETAIASKAESRLQKMTLAAAEISVESSLLHYSTDHYVGAIQLYGAADLCLAPEEIQVHYDHIPYGVPPELLAAGERQIKELQDQANSGEVSFFDGPCVRLLRWKASPANEGPSAVLERDILQLHLGPVGWYDVERTNGVLRRKLLRGQGIQYERWIGLSRLASHFDVAHSKLANLFGNAITILTTDGKVGFQERGIFQSIGGGQLSSAVAENVNRFFDETEPTDSSCLLNSIHKYVRLSDGPNNDYAPKSGVPHPVAAVRRGLNEETSWRMMNYVPSDGIKCTGLCFGLDSLHPDALWVVRTELTASEFERECKDHPGRDWREGRIRFVPADFENVDTQRVLERKEWISAGKASMVRAIEVVAVLKQRDARR